MSIKNKNLRSTFTIMNFTVSWYLRNFLISGVILTNVIFGNHVMKHINIWTFCTNSELIFKWPMPDITKSCMNKYSFNVQDGPMHFIVMICKRVRKFCCQGFRFYIATNIYGMILINFGVTSQKDSWNYLKVKVKS